MRRTLVAVWVVVLAGAVGLAVAGGPSELAALLLRPRPEVGRRAPDFTLTSLEGVPVSLGSFQGRPVIINFWASWCPPCREEMPHLQAAAKADEELVVLAVDATHTERRQEDVAAFVEEYGLTFPVVLDRDGAVNEEYLVRALPTSYFVDRQGVIRARYLGGMTPRALEENLKAIR
ncbi:TlpA family protein disulfide reductase [Limnochorda pilosa]|uniref:Thioredoxin domain-containing protein n=1 Tax=Limnochorda pilosa TaxID=1555112 RepID=A0A0K2SHN0_LIMPI|nr:TlpA disulfide reductase family protein [Limnochorda pilosa]BAS26542.1 hypothetical protein LIP_0685 [Limnochorda pilosa]